MNATAFFLLLFMLFDQGCACRKAHTRRSEIQGKPDERPVRSQVITLKMIGEFMSNDFRKSEDERAPELKSDLKAQLDELGDKPGQVSNRSAGQAGDSQGLSSEEDASNESVEELADTEQALRLPLWKG